MALLKKVRSATLVETILASAIILIVFLAASMSLNNIFLGTVKKDSVVALENRVKELKYLFYNHKIDVPYFEENDIWDISLELRDESYYLNTIHKVSGKEKLLTIEK